MNFVIIFPLILICLIATYTDLKSRKIYDWLTIPGMLYFLIAHAAIDTTFPVNSLIGLITLGGIAFCIAAVTNGQLGGGDIKLLALIGTALGWQDGLYAFIITYFIAGLFSLLYLLFARFFPRYPRLTQLPMALFITLGTGIIYL